MKKLVAPTASQVSFEHPSGKNLIVERLTRSNTDLSMASQILQLAIETYSHHYEAPHAHSVNFERPLMPGAVIIGYRRNNAKSALLQSMQERETTGGSYWIHRGFADGANGPLTVNGVAIAVPQKPAIRQKLTGGEPGCHILNLLVHPKAQNDYIGSALIYTAIKYGGFSEESPLSVDVTLNDPRNVLFVAKRGLQQNFNSQLRPNRVGDGYLQQASFEGQIGQILLAMEYQTPMLANSKVDENFE